MVINYDIHMKEEYR